MDLNGLALDDVKGGIGTMETKTIVVSLMAFVFVALLVTTAGVSALSVGSVVVSDSHAGSDVSVDADVAARADADVAARADADVAAYVMAFVGSDGDSDDASAEAEAEARGEVESRTSTQTQVDVDLHGDTDARVMGDSDSDVSLFVRLLAMIGLH